MKNQPRRTRWLIDFEVQYSLLRKIACHWLLFLIANALALLFWIRLFESPLDPWGETFARFSGDYFPILVVSIALLPVFLLDTAKLSNRFAGPILRIRSALSSAAAGEKVEPIHFRQGDFWKGLAVDFNQAFCGVRSNAKSNEPINNPQSSSYPES